MSDLLQFNSWSNFCFFSGITQRDETDDFDVFWDLQNLFYLWLVKGANPTSAKAKVGGHGQHISSCQGYIISSVFSLPGVKTQDEDNRSFFHMGGFDEEESGYLSDLSSRLLIGHDNEVPGLEICSCGSPSSCLKNLEEKILRGGIILVDPNGPSGL